jgi:hypothetical protein
VTEAEIDRALAQLDKLAGDASGWLNLYRDPVTGDLWEVSYPQGEMHGGGPRQLARVAAADAALRYPSATNPN